MSIYAFLADSRIRFPSFIPFFCLFSQILAVSCSRTICGVCRCNAQSIADKHRAHRRTKSVSRFFFLSFQITRSVFSFFFFHGCYARCRLLVARSLVRAAATHGMWDFCLLILFVRECKEYYNTQAHTNDVRCGDNRPTGIVAASEKREKKYVKKEQRTHATASRGSRKAVQHLYSSQLLLCTFS